jgi:hydroxymethylpyrimidine pyrophosphatase-like HAD family hydrolase
LKVAGEGREIIRRAAGAGTQIIAVDMDGTLLGEDGRVSERNLAALLAAENAGIEVVVATGRRHSYAVRILRGLRLRETTVLISSNGTVTRTAGGDISSCELVARSHLPLEMALWVCGRLGEFRNALVLTFDRVGADGEDARGALVVERVEELNTSIGRWMAVNEPYIAVVDPIEDALAADAPIQAMVCGTLERMARAEALLLGDGGLRASGEAGGRQGHAGLNLHRTEYPARDLSILDILPAGCSKGAALRTLAEARGVDMSQVMAIGDNWNDVPMLEVAGRPVLMANAPDDLKDLARACGWTIGLSNVADGVADAVEAMLGAQCGPASAGV